MERELFTHTGWDEAGDYGDIQFYNCTLVRDIGEFKAGQVVQVITLLISKGVIQFWNDDGSTMLKEYKLSFQVCE